MKKILIVNNNLHSGGVQRSLVNLLNFINDDYDVTLYLLYNEGELKQFVPSNVKIIEAPKALRVLGMRNSEVKSESTLLYLWRSINVVFTKIFSNLLPVKILTSFQKKISGYDIAISYMQNTPGKILYGGPNEVVLNRIDAPCKVAFLHCDFLNVGINNEKTRDTYKRFDKIACCSDGCKKSFLTAIPEMSDKTYTVRNFNMYSDIKIAADEYDVDYPNNTINIVTVARLNEEKGIERALEAVKNCLENGIKLHYHIVGDGDQREIYKQKLVDLKIENYVTFYLNKDNPYPYIKNADLFLLPSYHEAAPMVFDEAKFLCTPVMATKTTSTDDMVIKDEIGWVCENNQSSINETLLKLCSNPETIKNKNTELLRRTFDNTLSLKQINDLLNT